MMSNVTIPKTHKKIPRFVPLLNPLIKSMLRLGVRMGPMTLLTVRGRKTGRPHATPVAMLERDGRRYVIGTFGDVNWVRNLRAARGAKIGKGRRRETVSVQELTPEQAATVFRDIFALFLSSRTMSSFLKMGYDLSPSSTPEDYQREAQRHPAFEVHA